MLTHCRYITRTAVQSLWELSSTVASGQQRRDRQAEDHARVETVVHETGNFKNIILFFPNKLF